MFIKQGFYDFYSGNVIIKDSFEIVKETDKCYFTENKRYLKSDLNIPILRSSSQYPYIELTMRDATEEMLRNKLAEWFTRQAILIWGKDV